MIHVKWAGPNSPFIKMQGDDRRLYLSKRELITLMHEIEAFTQYYKEQFTDERIDIKDEIYEPSQAETQKGYEEL